MTYFDTTYCLLPASCWGGLVAFGGLDHIMVYTKCMREGRRKGGRGKGDILPSEPLFIHIGR